MTVTMGDVRKAIAATSNCDWQPRSDLPDDAPVPEHGTGEDQARRESASDAPPLDLLQVLSRDVTANPALLQRRLSLGMPQLHASPDPVSVVMTESGTARPPVVDWRSRWGGSWLATIQDQRSANNCWAFAAAALVETMVRIEHSHWAKRSEGDLRDGWGVAEQDWMTRDGVAPSRHGAGVQDALAFIVRMGIADLGCYPWYVNDHAYDPTADRSARTANIAGYQTIGAVEEQKRWLDAVGPLAASFTAYDDFKAYGSGVYRKSAYEELFSKGNGHVVLVVGYDDQQQCWIIRNSWGTGWGEAGYGLIAYGEVGIDAGPKYGLHGVSPDPWSKRRLHNGCVLESERGAAHRNLEMVRSALPRAVHLWRAGGEDGDFSWNVGEHLEDPADVGAGAGSLGFPTLTATTFGRNLECVHWELSGRLRHWWFDAPSGRWMNGGQFGPADVAGYPGFIQSSYGAPGNLEVVVRAADGRLHHWWRDNAAPWTWHEGAAFADGVLQSGPSLVQSGLGTEGNLDVVCVLNSGSMQHWWRDDDGDRSWNGGTIFGTGVGDTPIVMIEGTSGANDELTAGNFELCVAVDGRVQHWWRNNAYPERRDGGRLRPLHPDPRDWTHSDTFGHDVRHVWGLVQGSFGQNLELIVERTDGVAQHYWRDGAGWHEGAAITS
ncbi:MAG: Papain family cysteine protease [Pseudonocardiales bacterium]|nr:Papain family cysteine protease [Pseudonocardiales bacterium]